MHHHTMLWQEKDAKNLAKSLGTHVEGSWYWYQPWLEQVREHCKQNAGQYT